MNTQTTRLAAALAKAIEEIEFWAQDADDYFQDKYDLRETLAELRAVLLAEGGSSE